MKRLSESLLKQAERYFEMKTPERREFIETLYNEPYLMSFQAIGELVGTTGKKVRKHHPKMKTRDRSESQLLALKTGRNTHPTKGRIRTAEEKEKISEGIAKTWRESSKEHKEAMAKKSKDRWEKMSDIEKQELTRKARSQLRTTASVGSRLEHILHEKLVEAGYQVAFHKKHLIVNEKLEIDLMIPAHKIVIEVDGPTHFTPIWGEKRFQKVQAADAQKNALLLTKGFVVIRLRHHKSPSQKDSRDLFNELLETVNRVVNDRPTNTNDCLIYLGAKE